MILLGHRGLEEQPHCEEEPHLIWFRKIKAKNPSPEKDSLATITLSVVYAFNFCDLFLGLEARDFNTFLGTH
jgi:hypothetical protein